MKLYEKILIYDWEKWSSQIKQIKLYVKDRADSIRILRDILINPLWSRLSGWHTYPLHPTIYTPLRGPFILYFIYGVVCNVYVHIAMPVKVIHNPCPFVSGKSKSIFHEP